MALFKVITSKAPIETAIKYINRERDKDLVNIAYCLRDGINCSSDTALDEMRFIKDFYMKNEGQQYIHSVLSFTKDESKFITPQEALHMMRYLMETVDDFVGFQTVLAVHEDKKNLHVHAITNSVSMVDGKKTKWNRFSLKHLQDKITLLISDYNAEHPNKIYNALDGDGTKYKERNIEELLARKGKSWVAFIIDAFLEVLGKSLSKNDFLLMMLERGIDVSSEWDSDFPFELKILEGTYKGKRIKNTTLKKYLKKYFDYDMDLTARGLLNIFESNRGKQSADTYSA